MSLWGHRRTLADNPLPDHFNTRRPDLGVVRDNRQPQRQGGGRNYPVRQIGYRASGDLPQAEGDLNSQRNSLKVGIGLIYHLPQSRQRLTFNPILFGQISCFDNTDGRNKDGLVLIAGLLHSFPRTTREPSVGRQVPENRMRVGDDRIHSEDCSFGAPPHISLRASAMSSSDMEMPRSFQRPYELFRGPLGFVPKNFAKSSTSSCLSVVSSRSLATTASSIGWSGIPSYYLATQRGILPSSSSAFADPDPSGTACCRQVSPGSAGISQTEIAPQVRTRDKLASRDSLIAFLNGSHIRIAQRFVAPALRQKMQKTAGDRPVVFSESVDQAMQFFIPGHALIVDEKVAE